MKNFYPIQHIDFRFQIDHFKLKRIRLIEEKRDNSNHASLFINVFNQT